jgi:dimethylaniline monooxygenase (N-oxide forming)
MVLCNGYTAQFPWLQIPGFDSNPRSWFLHCFPKNLGDSLFFIGYARPHQGGIPAMADILSRYVAQVVAGERKLPDDYAEQARQNGIAEREYYYISPDLHILVDYNAFLESVARRIGCEPRLPIWATALVNLHLLATAFLLVHAVQPDWNVLGFPLALAVWISTIGLGVIADDGMLAKWLFYPCESP